MSGDYRIALRPDDDEGAQLDEALVRDVELVHADMMSDTTLSLLCHLDNDHHVAFWIRATRRKGQPLRLEFTCTDSPPESDDITYEEQRNG